MKLSELLSDVDDWKDELGDNTIIEVEIDQEDIVKMFSSKENYFRVKVKDVSFDTDSVLLELDY